MKAQREQIVTPTDQSFRAFAMSAQRFDHPFHFHPEIELTLITAGAGTRLVGDAVASFQPGDLCLIGENLPHLYHTPEDAAGGQKSRAIVVQFRREACGGVFTAAEMAPIASLIKRANQGLRFHDDDARRTEPKLERLRRLSGPARVASLIELLALLAEAYAETLASPGYSPTLNDFHGDRISKACRYILDHYDQDLSHADVAAHVGLTPSAFSRFFQRATNQTYQQFIGELRLGRASRLLVETDLSITEICYAAGFGNLSNFNRRFKAARGLTPREFRTRTATR